MLLTDYFRSEPDATWDFALQSGVTHGVIRLPEDADFDLADASHWQSVYQRFTEFGITPVVIEPMPSCVHDHIKLGDSLADACIEKVIRMFPIMQSLHIETICFNWMAHIGWLRTRTDFPERGGARVTGFDAAHFQPDNARITQKELWDNYAYFIQAVIPEAEKHGIRLALHPDDPPVPSLGAVERIMVHKANIKKAVYEIINSPSLGLTMCQANFFLMGVDLEQTIAEFADRIYLIHFRNVTGCPSHFRETFHDNGDIDMAKLMHTYIRNGIDVPIRVDHVPTMVGERSTLAGYDTLGRLFAIGYLKGLLESAKYSWNIADR